MNGEPLVVEIVRSGAVESRHVVDVAVVDAAGRLVAFAGDPDVRAAYRSSAKPIQARVALESGWSPAETSSIAIACASHSGEPEHVQAVRRVLAGAGVDEDMLACPPDLPATPDALLGARARARIYFNCSGKHAGMLAACAAAGWPLEGYRAPEHPLQVRIRALVARLCGEPEAVLVDGCGVPTFVLPLRALATGFLGIDGGKEAEAMRAHPILVAGSGRFDTDLMTAAPHVLSKGGAEGLACAAAGGIAVAVKSRDGAARCCPPAMLAVLTELGLVDDGLLPGHASPPVLGGGEPVGAARTHGRLTKD